jgi:serine/threonine-protein kinase RsbT
MTTPARPLPDSWSRLFLREESDVWAARPKVREACQRAGCTEAATEALTIAVSEVARNIIVYAGDGELFMGVAAGAKALAVVVKAVDRGPGIADLGAAMTDGYSTGGSLGLGLPSAKRLVDEFEIVTGPAGTTVTMWKWGGSQRFAGRP